MGLLHLVQGAAVLLLSSDFSLPVTSSFLQFDPAEQRLLPQPDVLFDVAIGPLVAAFLLLSALRAPRDRLTAGSRWPPVHRGTSRRRVITRLRSDGVLLQQHRDDRRHRVHTRSSVTSPRWSRSPGQTWR